MAFRAYEIAGGFGLDNLRLVERQQKPLGPHQVRLRMKAMSLNYRDILTIQGLYNPKQPLPLIPLSDGVGEVVEVGSEVTRVQVGQRVAGLFAQAWHDGQPTREQLRTTLGGPLDGVLAEEVVLHEDGVVSVPEYLTDAEAATLPCAAVTAWSALVEQGNVKPGSLVLTLGTGGVSCFALMFAKLMGARVIITSSSDEKLERARALGADHGVNYRIDTQWEKTVRELSGGVGVDHVIEVGGAGTFDRSVRCLKPGGYMSLIGILSGGADQINLVPILMQNIRVQGVLVGHGAAFTAMNQALLAHGLRPVVDNMFAFDEVNEAISWMAEGRHFGKVCIQV